MKSKKLMSKIITAVVAGGVLLSSGSYVFAKSSTNTLTGAASKKQEARMNKKNPADIMKAELDKLVTNGTITADQETKVLDYLKQKDTERQTEMDKVKNMTETERKTYFENNKPTEKTNFLSELVTNGTLTQAQADAISNVSHKGLGRKERGGNPEQAKTELDKLVTAGTITADQETAILNSITQEQAARQAEMDKLKNMTEAERETYFENNKPSEKTDLLNSLVTAGTITKDQADAVAKVIHQGPGRKEFGGNQEMLKAKLDKLVAAGTITQDEETKIVAYMKQKETDRKAEMDKIKNMTEAERKTYFENNKKEKIDFTAELVTAGIISQDKADAIKAAMPTQKVMFRTMK